MRDIVRSDRHRRTLFQVMNAVLAGFVPLAFIYFAVRYVGHVATIRNVDYFQFVEMAQGLDSGSLRSWVSGMHPIGYPLLIRWGLAAGFDAVQIGHILSVVGGVLLLISAYLLCYQLTHDRWLALLTESFLATTGYFFYFATFEGNDMLSAGLQGLSLAVLIGLSADRKTNFAAGVLAGLAYTIRYTAIVTSALCLLFLVGRALIQRRRSMWIVGGLFLVGFILGAAPQLIPSTLVTGNPFYSVRSHDVWWHVKGLTDFATEWRQAPMDISPVQVFLDSPMRFIRHWWDTARSFWLDPDLLLLDKPLRLFTQAALVFTLVAGDTIDVRRRGLLALYVFGLLSGLAIIRYDPRFLIVVLPILVFCGVYFVWKITPRDLSIGRFMLPIRSLVLAVLLIWSVDNPLDALDNAPTTNPKILSVSNTLYAGGMQSPDEVISSAIPFHDVSSLARTRYDQSYWVAPTMNSVEALHAIAEQRGYRFVLYDANTGPKAHPGLSELLNPYTRPSRLTPLRVPEGREYVLYRIESERPRPNHPLEVHLDEGVTLMGYDLYVAYDAPDKVVPRVGIFLYWKTTQGLSNSYKVFVHVLTPEGQLIAQDDSEPALWTYPTEEWEPAEVVVDFHDFTLPNAPVPDTYTLQVGLYDQTTMQRLSVLSPEGDPLDDKITLTPLILDLNETKGGQE